MKSLVLTLVFTFLFAGFASAAYTVDQESLNGGAAFILNPPRTAIQTFKPSVTEVKQVELSFWVNNPQGTQFNFNVLVEIKTTGATSTPLCSGSYAVSGSDSSFGVLPLITMSSGCNQLTPESTYQLVVSSTNPQPNGANLQIWGADVGGDYDRGYLKYNGNDLPNGDLWFRTYYNYFPIITIPDTSYFHDLTFSWTSIAKAQKYRVEIQYLGGCNVNPAWPCTNGLNTPMTAPLTYRDNPGLEVTKNVLSLQVGLGPLDKQPTGEYKMRVNSCIGSSPSACTWNTNPEWTYFALNYIPQLNKINGQDYAELTPSTVISWDCAKHNAAINGGATNLVMMLEGFNTNKCKRVSGKLPASCYIPLDLKSVKYGLTKCYYTFDQNTYYNMPAGSYAVSLGVFYNKDNEPLYRSNGKYSAYHDRRLPKTKFGQPITFVKD